jgi:hypothetical protein
LFQFLDRLVSLIVSFKRPMIDRPGHCIVVLQAVTPMPL